MAEFLIYNQDHWMDRPSKDRPDLLGYDNVVRKINEKPMLTTKRQTALFEYWQKYTRRYQFGDIVEVRKDGSPSGRLEKDSFAFIQSPIAYTYALQYTKSHMDGETLLHRCKFWFDLTGLVLDKDSRVSVSPAEFNNRLKVKK